MNNNEKRCASMPIDTGALIWATMHLTTLEFGAYFRLLMYSWNHPEHLMRELGDDQLMRITGLSNHHWDKSGRRLMGMLNR